MGKYNVESLKGDDFVSFIDLANVFRESLPPEFRQDIGTVISDSSNISRCVVCRYDGMAIGGYYSRDLDEKVELHLLAVSSQHRRKGVGQSLIENLENESLQQKKKRVELFAHDENSLRWYLNRDYVLVDKGEHYFLEKKLG